MPDITIDRAFERLVAEDILLLDVRSPGEYEKGHIPGAQSFPLFDDDERAEVGSLYVQRSRDEAIERGLDMVGPRMSSMVRQARGLAGGRLILLYCWRGGMRSGAMAWLLQNAGLTVDRITGGYKAFRAAFDTLLSTHHYSLLILGGPTGSGKTDVLHSLAELGEQVIDLEGLANHRGSAFGAIGQAAQPSTEQFMNLLHTSLRSQNPNERIWLESESITIGKVFVPNAFYEQMLASPLIHLQVPRDIRVEHIYRDYGGFDPDELRMAFERIQKRLGFDQLQLAHRALDSGDIRMAIDIALVYYDKAYHRSLSGHWGDPACTVIVDKDDPRQTAERLISEYEAYCRSHASTHPA